MSNETTVRSGEATVTGTVVLQAFDLYRFYHAGEDETLALRGVSMHVNEGEIV
ncbi:MAG: ABC transporter ATP-binding protein, partial [Chloroflexota bacterium]